MPHVQQLAARRARRSPTTSSPTRSAARRARRSSPGRIPHDTGVFTNGGADGGFASSTRTATRRDVRHRACTPRLPHGVDGQVPQRLHAAGRVDRKPRYSRLAGASGTSPATATRSSTTTSTRTARSCTTARWPQRYLTDVLARAAVASSTARPAQALLPRDRHLRAARALHAGAAGRRRLPGAAGAAYAGLQRGRRRGQTALAARPPPLTATQINKHRRGVPRACAGGPGGRPS